MISNPSQTLNVNIRSRKKNFFTGKTFSVTSINNKGEFDILPLHANFISLIKNYVILSKGTENEQKFALSTGVLRVKENRVDVFLDV